MKDPNNTPSHKGQSEYKKFQAIVEPQKPENNE